MSARLAVRVDLRMPAVAAATWLGVLLVAQAPRWCVVGTPVVGVLVVALCARSARVRLLTALLVTLLVAMSITGLRVHLAGAGRVPDLAEQRSRVVVGGVVASDARQLTGAWSKRWVWQITAHSVVAHDEALSLRRSLLVFSDESAPPLGAEVRLIGRLGPSDRPDDAATMTLLEPIEVVDQPSVWWRASGALRSSIRDSVAHRPPIPRSLVPALVDGDDSAVVETVAEDFSKTGLTHLLAVSGTNLTLMVGFLIGSARWCGVRGRWLVLVGAIGIVGFVLLARTEPSVLRAAAMGAVGLVGLAVGPSRGLRVLAAAVVVLLFLAPGLATSVGFLLSVLATGGIVLWSGPFSAALGTWLPRSLAESIAVPLAAQLACTPVIAAISGRVSLVAVGANILVAPVVGPATVLGLLGGVAGLVAPPVGRLLGTGASWCVSWIATVAQQGAGLPTPAVSWGTSAGAVALLAVLTAVVIAVTPVVLRRRRLAVVSAMGLIAVVLIGPGTIWPRAIWPGGAWPPADWIVVACDVGQGDAIALRTGPKAAIVVDAGPEPAEVDRCLSDLDIEVVPLLVLTHFHADHVDGLAGVLAGRSVGAIEVTTRLDPPQGVRDVLSVARDADLEPSYAQVGRARSYGSMSLQMLWPPDPAATLGAGDGSSANDSSIVVLAEIHGIRVLLTGDVEPVSQARLARAYPHLVADVLKVPHHGSRHQDMGWLGSLGAVVGLVSVGADNDYGHPADEVIAGLTRAGMAVGRTDSDGDLAVVVRDGRAVMVTRRRRRVAG